MKTPSFARGIDEVEAFDETVGIDEVDPGSNVLDLTREEDREKLGRVVRIMSEQAVYAELAMLARTAKDRSTILRPLDAAARTS
jgi:hypothetical protein